MDILEIISGNRVMFSICTIGGVRRDIKNPKQILRMLDKLRKPMDHLYETFDCNTQILDKTKGIGILSYKKAKELAVVGPTAEASGILNDIRKEAPYAAYNQIKLKPTILQEGDAYSRIIIRFWEIFESIDILQQLIKKMPCGPIAIPEISSVPAGYGIGRVEAPRGELFHFLITDGSKIPKRLKIRPPTFANLPAVREMLIGEKKENMSLILASVDPCFACTER
jgi:Ni,Fe-hydrogenase III large subunit